MAITYSNFLTQIRSYAEVDSNVLSDTLLDQFIRNTELDIAGKVDYDDTRKYSTSNFNLEAWLPLNLHSLLSPGFLIYQYYFLTYRLATQATQFQYY